VTDAGERSISATRRWLLELDGLEFPIEPDWLLLIPTLDPSRAATEPPKAIGIGGVVFAPAFREGKPG